MKEEIRFVCVLPAETHAKLKALADADQRSMSKVLTRLIVPVIDAQHAKLKK